MLCSSRSVDGVALPSVVAGVAVGVHRVRAHDTVRSVATFLEAHVELTCLLTLLAPCSGTLALSMMKFCCSSPLEVWSCRFYHWGPCPKIPLLSMGGQAEGQACGDL